MNNNITKILILWMLVGTLGGTLLGNLLQGKVIKAKKPGGESNIHGQGVMRPDETAVPKNLG